MRSFIRFNSVHRFNQGWGIVCDSDCLVLVWMHCFRSKRFSIERMRSNPKHCTHSSGHSDNSCKFMVHGTINLIKFFLSKSVSGNESLLFRVRSVPVTESTPCLTQGSAHTSIKMQDGCKRVTYCDWNLWHPGALCNWKHCKQNPVYLPCQGPVLNPVFPRGGSNSLTRYDNLLLCKIVAENCIKMKEFLSGEDASLAPPTPLDPPLKVRTLSFNRDRLRIRTCTACSEQLVVFAAHTMRTLTLSPVCSSSEASDPLNVHWVRWGHHSLIRRNKLTRRLVFPFYIIYPSIYDKIHHSIKCSSQRQRKRCCWNFSIRCQIISRNCA